MTEIDEDEHPACPICGDETFGRPCETSYCAGHRAGYQRGHEAGHEDAGLAAIARASAAYEAGYAACRETMTPAVLATEDAYLLGHEAGRLAAIRAEVVYARRAMERDAAAHARNVASWNRAITSKNSDAEDRASLIGYSNGERRRLIRSTKFLAATRRWLQETA